MNDIMERTLGILSGAAIAILLGTIAIAFVTLAFRFFPAFAEQATWFPWIALIVIPVIAFVCIGAALWQKRRPMAVGILLSALVLSTHFAIHVATHGNS